MQESKTTSKSGTGTPRTEDEASRGTGGNARNALIIFVKNADPGRVKTRLAADLGESRTLEVYLRLVAHTLQQAGRLGGLADIFVCFSREIPRQWPDISSTGFPESASGLKLFDGTAMRIQQGKDLGERMNRAFLDVFEGGYGRAVIIGSDCPELETGHLQQAFDVLTDHDTVVGPAADGGYYLLGMREPHPEVFRNKSWSTDTVFRQTMQDFRRAGLRTFLLPELRDMDVAEDYRRLGHLLQDPGPEAGPEQQKTNRSPQRHLHPHPHQHPHSSTRTDPRVSIIIPVYEEESGLGTFLRELGSVLEPHPPEQVITAAVQSEAGAAQSGREHQVPPVPFEIIIVDGGSADKTVAVAREAGFRCVVSPRKGRAAQMNHGAELAKGEIIYFLHADTLPPPRALPKILKAMEDGVRSGCFRLAFDEPSRLMRFYAWFTRFDLLPFRYGDQSLFVCAQLFRRLGGFREDHVVMEDNEFMRRLRKQSSFTVMPDRVVTSARKYRENGFVRLQLIFTLIFVMYYLGFGQDTLVSLYRRLIARSKL